MGLRFPSPLSMPYVVSFPYQALHPVGMGDSGLVLAEHLQFLLTHAGVSSTAWRKISGHPFQCSEAQFQCQRPVQSVFLPVRAK